jgi:hypothetical protein
MMTLEDIHALILHELEAMQDLGYRPRYPRAGICLNCEQYITDIADIIYGRNGPILDFEDYLVSLGISFRDWPHFSGDLTFPIPDPAGSDFPEMYYNRQGADKWGETSGNRRRELAKWLHQQITERI